MLNLVVHKVNTGL